MGVGSFVAPIVPPVIIASLKPVVRSEKVMMFGNGEFKVNDPSKLENVIRKFRKFLLENISRELRMREEYCNRAKLKRGYALRRLRKRQRKERMFDG